MAHHLVYNDGDDLPQPPDGELWPHGAGKVVDTLDEWVGPMIAAGRLSDLGLPPKTDDVPADAPKAKGTR